MQCVGVLLLKLLCAVTQVGQSLANERCSTLYLVDIMSAAGSATSAAEECPVCKDALDNTKMALRCGHLFHEQCLNELAPPRNVCVCVCLGQLQYIANCHRHLVCTFVRGWSS